MATQNKLSCLFGYHELENLLRREWPYMPYGKCIHCSKLIRFRADATLDSVVDIQNENENFFYIELENNYEHIRVAVGRKTFSWSVIETRKNCSNVNDSK